MVLALLVVVVVVGCWWFYFRGRHCHVIILNITAAPAAVIRMGAGSPPWHCMCKWAYCT